MDQSDERPKQTTEEKVVAQQSEQVPMPSVPTVPPTKESSKKLLVIVSALVLLVLAGVVSYWYMAQNEGKTQSQQTEQSAGPEAGLDMPAPSYKKTIYTNNAGNTATVEHPDNWEVENKTEENDNYTEKSTEIVSPAGYSLRLYERTGIGGACDSNNFSFTLVKKLPTATPGVYFTQYDVDSADDHTSIEHLILESFVGDFVPESHRSIAEGDTGTDTCTNLFLWSAYKDIFVNVRKKVNGSYEYVAYEDIASDTEFVKMLQSLKIDDK